MSPYHALVTQIATTAVPMRLEVDPKFKYQECESGASTLNHKASVYKIKRILHFL